MSEPEIVFRNDRLRRAREQRGLTQRELARLCGIGENQINRYENGGGDPSASNLKAIAQQVGVSADYLLGLSDSPMNRTDDSLEPAERKLLDAFAAADGPTMLEIISERLRRAANVPTRENTR